METHCGGVQSDARGKLDRIHRTIVLTHHLKHSFTLPVARQAISSPTRPGHSACLFAHLAPFHSHGFSGYTSFILAGAHTNGDNDCAIGEGETNGELPARCRCAVCTTTGYAATAPGSWWTGSGREEMTKEKADLNEWCKEIAPSPELRKWYNHDPERFEEFTHRYKLELTDPARAEAVAHLRQLAREGTLTLLTASKAVHISEAAVLAESAALTFDPAEALAGKVAPPHRRAPNDLAPHKRPPRRNRRPRRPAESAPASPRSSPENPVNESASPRVP